MISVDDISTYMDFARRAAQRSRATRLKVGAVLVNDDRIMSMGYNGTPSGWCNVCEDANDNTLPEVIHAEMNCLFKFSQGGLSTKGTTMFITHSPCLPCAKPLFLAGVKRVYYLEEYRSLDGVDFLRLSGVDVIKMD